MRVSVELPVSFAVDDKLPDVIVSDVVCRAEDKEDNVADNPEVGT
jgi:hypothetical protein